MIGKSCYKISKLKVKRKLSYISLKLKIECMYKTAFHKYGNIYVRT